MANLHPLDAAGSVPDAGAYIAAFSAASVRARAEYPVQRALAYGRSAAETLDLFSALPGAPLVAFMHGGYWHALSKDDFSFIAQGLLPLGIAFASIDYGLAPQTPLRDIVAQCRRAVDWLHANAERLGYDAERITVCGHSAGGHLAAMTAVTTPVHAVASISGLHDLLPVQASFVNEWIGLDVREARELSPVVQRPARPCRIFTTAGERESDEFKAQGRALIEAWLPYGCEGSYSESPDDDHFTICGRLGDPAHPLTQTIAELARG